MAPADPVVESPAPPAPSTPPVLDSPSAPQHAAADEGALDDDEDVDSTTESTTTVTDILRELATAPEPVGHRSRSPMPKLTPGQAETQAKLYAILERRGVKMRTQGDVYGWLLDTFNEATW